MQLAVVAAGFTPGEADQLRRAMAAWKRRGGLEPFHDKFVGGMLANGYAPQYAEAIYNQIKGFGEYGFPESHAASFALLAYASAWLKRHHPAAFTCGLLNSQPMGFYSPSQLVQDARRHGIDVRPADVTASDWDCTLERKAAGATQTQSAVVALAGGPGQAADDDQHAAHGHDRLQPSRGSAGRIVQRDEAGAPMDNGQPQANVRLKSGIVEDPLDRDRARLRASAARRC